MGEPVEKHEQPSKEIDAAFIKVFDSLSSEILKDANSAISFIIESAATFSQGNAKEALSDFQKLYSNREDEIKNASEEINANVDNLVDFVKEQLDRGETPNLSEQHESEENARDRLALSAIQKRLEALITIDESIKEKLMPVVTGMQFEDIARQRLQNIQTYWVELIELMSNETPFDTDEKLMEYSKITKSVAETEQFYEIVFGKPAPEEVLNPSETVFDILF